MRSLILLLCLSALGFAQVDDARRGVFTRTFKVSHRESALTRQCLRNGWTPSFIKRNDPVAKHGLEKESFVLYVPKHYDGTTPFGAMVWISVGKDGAFPQEWTAVLDRLNMIGIAPNNCGNNRLLWYRTALALDAATNLGLNYKIDSERTYVAGYSGGGRSATRVAMLYPDVFAGGIYNGGANYFKRIPRPGSRAGFWPKRFPKPTGRAWGLTRSKSRHVFICGEDDPNREHSRRIAHDMNRNERFKHVEFLTMKGKAHDYADVEHFEKALRLLDEPVIKRREHEARQRAKKELRKKLMALGKDDREKARKERRKKAALERAKKREEARKAEIEAAEKEAAKDSSDGGDEKKSRKKSLAEQKAEAIRKKREAKKKP